MWPNTLSHNFGSLIGLAQALGVDEGAGRHDKTEGDSGS